MVAAPVRRRTQGYSILKAKGASAGNGISWQRPPMAGWRHRAGCRPPFPSVLWQRYSALPYSARRKPAYHVEVDFLGHKPYSVLNLSAPSLETE